LRRLPPSTVEEAAAACEKLDELMMGGLAGCFTRVEPRRQARKYVTELLSDLPRKNCWVLAEQAGDASPDQMQRLLERGPGCRLGDARGACVRGTAPG
jgi:hypothetical protein